MKIIKTTLWTAVGLFGLATLVAMPAAADQVILDDLIVDGSACIGFDCVNGESFGFDTIRIKENNLRIKAQDTSSSGSFPSNDWQITFNDSANGGANKFSIDDIDGGRTPFTIEAGAPSHSLYVDDGGRIGSRTSTPSVEIHTIDGDTPTLRLQQDGSSGFAPQTWDVAGNETNFFIRDVTNGSTLPFRIRPDAPTSAIDIAADGDVGIGTSSPGNLIGGNTPQASLHILRSDGEASILVEENNTTNLARDMLELRSASGPVRVQMNRESVAESWTWVASNTFILNNNNVGGNEFQLTGNGDLTIAGSINTTDCSPCTSDYVFEPDYELMPLDELEAFVWREKHLPNVPSQGDVDRAGKLNMTEMQMKMLEKIEELTLYTIEQQKTIDALSARLEGLVKSPE
jgi:hypothetical protein